MNRVSRRDYLKLLGAERRCGRFGSVSRSRPASFVSQTAPQPKPAGGVIQRVIADRERRMKWWHEAKFGMFIHWGLYSVLGRHEWVMEMEGIPAAEYEELAKRFKPKPNAARDWARLAKRAGQKYMVMTTKHHEGFCHFDTQTTNYCAPKQGPGRDLVSRVCRRRARRRPARRLLLLADGLASSGRCALRDRRSRAPPLCRLHSYADPRVADQLWQDRHSLVRRLLAAGCQRAGSRKR